MEYKIDWIGENSYLIFNGNVNFDIVNKADGDLIGDSRFDCMKFSIFDFTNVEEFILSKQELLIISTLDKGASRWNGNLKLALLANKNNFNVNIILRKYKNLMKNNNWDIALFHDINTALNWCTDVEK